MNRTITAILTTFLVVFALADCGDQNRKIVIRYPHQMQYINHFKQEGTQKLQVWQGDSLVYSLSRSLDFNISQRVLRVLPDSSAAVEENSTMLLIGQNRKDTTVIDTMKEDRSFIIYEAPNGRIVDFETKGKYDSLTTAHFRSWYEQACPVFPDSAVGIGSTWVNSNTVVVDSQKLETSTSFKVRGFEQMRGYDCIVVEFSGNIILPIRSDPKDTMLRGGMDEIRVDGTFWFAWKEGFFAEQSQKEVILGRRDLVEKGKPFTRNYRIDGNARMYIAERQRI
jgi:hypothetical protein